MRTEFLYLDRTTAPGETEQVAAYRAILDALPGKPVVIRTLDIGGDKPLPYVSLPAESNSFLGLQLIRMTARADGAAGKWVGCGELAGVAAAAPLLIGLGIIELSMNPAAIPAVKAALRRWTRREARETARRALMLDSAGAVRALLAERAIPARW